MGFREKLAGAELISRLQRETLITLDDLIDRRLYTDPPAEPCAHLPVGSWPLCYAEDISTEDKGRLSKGRKASPELVKAAAALVLSVTGTTTKFQKGVIFDYTRYIETRCYEEEQTKRRSEGGKITAAKRKEVQADKLEKIRAYWTKLQDKPEHARAGIIAERLDMPVNTVRLMIRKAGLKKAGLR